MSFPPEIKIGPMIYNVSYRDKILATPEDKEYASGLIDIAKEKITIQSGYSSTFEKVVVLHEIWHGMLEQTAFDNEDEGLVDTLAYKTLELILDNPKLMKYLQKEQNDSVE